MVEQQRECQWARGNEQERERGLDGHGRVRTGGREGMEGIKAEIDPVLIYRNEAMDATHLAEFFQVEGVVADYDITLGHLIGM